MPLLTSAVRVSVSVGVRHSHTINFATAVGSFRKMRNRDNRCGLPVFSFSHLSGLSPFQVGDQTVHDTGPGFMDQSCHQQRSLIPVHVHHRGIREDRPAHGNGHVRLWRDSLRFFFGDGVVDTAPLCHCACCGACCSASQRGSISSRGESASTACHRETDM